MVLVKIAIKNRAWKKRREGTWSKQAILFDLGQVARPDLRHKMLVCSLLSRFCLGGRRGLYHWSTYHRYQLVQHFHRWVGIIVWSSRHLEKDSDLSETGRYFPSTPRVSESMRPISVGVGGGPM